MTERKPMATEVTGDADHREARGSVFTDVRGRTGGPRSVACERRC